MPQKKNPVVLEHLKGKSGHFLAAFARAATAVKGTHFTNTAEGNQETGSALWEVLPSARGCAVLLDLVAGTVSPKRDVMGARAREDFSTATDLADLLVREAGFSFRQAHHIVGAVVRAAVERSLPANKITTDMVEEAARAIAGRSAVISEDALSRALDPLQSIQHRNTIGGPAPQEVRRMAVEGMKRIEQENIELQRRRDRLNAAAEMLQARTRKFART